jgi:hypothetical protein
MVERTTPEPYGIWSGAVRGASTPASLGAPTPTALRAATRTKYGVPGLRPPRSSWNHCPSEALATRGLAKNAGGLSSDPSARDSVGFALPALPALPAAAAAEELKPGL